MQLPLLGACEPFLFLPQSSQSTGMFTWWPNHAPSQKRMMVVSGVEGQSGWSSGVPILGSHNVGRRSSRCWNTASTDARRPGGGESPMLSVVALRSIGSCI
jgi:hypothetical protein